MTAAPTSRFREPRRAGLPHPSPTASRRTAMVSSKRRRGSRGSRRERNSLRAQRTSCSPPRSGGPPRGLRGPVAPSPYRSRGPCIRLIDERPPQVMYVASEFKAGMSAAGVRALLDGRPSGRWPTVASEAWFLSGGASRALQAEVPSGAPSLRFRAQTLRVLSVTPDNRHYRRLLNTFRRCVAG